MSSNNKRPGDALEAVPKKRATSGRTGQACDRCKLRKIRCDARLGGCSPCLQNNTECKTTDRITGRATTRGHAENLEAENGALRFHIQELTQQLRANNIEPIPGPAPGGAYTPQTHPPYGQQWGSLQNEYRQSATHSQRHGSAGGLLPEYRSGCIGDNYLGVSFDTPLSSVEGTSLSLFGTKIDLTEFMPKEPNPDSEAFSYQTFLTYAFGAGSPTDTTPYHASRALDKRAQVRASPPGMPSYDRCTQLADYFFRSVVPFVPVLHRPDFMRLLTRIFNENHRPSAAESVMVNEMLANMYWQFSTRNGGEGGEQYRRTSFQHHFYALTFVPDLIASHKLEDMQALAMICAYLRCQSRPGAAWMFISLVFSLAVESGLHRSASAWPPGTFDAHTVELRKRVFWTLLMFHVSVGGKLGRPMPIRLEDFDIEIPEPADDTVPGEVNVSEWKKCSFRAGIECFKGLRVTMQVYSTIYAINPKNSEYDLTVRQLGRDLHAWQIQLPPELAGGPETVNEDRVAAAYITVMLTEAKLLLHHPALCRTNIPSIAAANLDSCLDATSRMLHAACQIKQLKALDTTPYFTTSFLAAIFTTLFIHNERKNILLPADFAKLRQDMDAWLDVLGHIGHMMGSGSRLRDAIGVIIDRHLGELSAAIAPRTASAVVASVNGNAENGSSYPQPPTAAAEYYPYQQYAQVTDTPAAASAGWDPMSWRNFAENLMSPGISAAQPMPQSATGSAYGHAFSAGVPQMHPMAGFAEPGGMPLPDTSQSWPLVQYTNVPTTAQATQNAESKYVDANGGGLN